MAFATVSFGVHGRQRLLVNIEVSSVCLLQYARDAAQQAAATRVQEVITAARRRLAAANERLAALARRLPSDAEEEGDAKVEEARGEKEAAETALAEAQAAAVAVSAWSDDSLAAELAEVVASGRDAGSVKPLSLRSRPMEYASGLLRGRGEYALVLIDEEGAVTPMTIAVGEDEREGDAADAEEKKSAGERKEGGRRRRK
eukprot:PLAT5589.1.p2 GENE.PLAT5589.1~~PLAT5589.1.p2  ORF type:complete len:201 (+),score=81.82 PLAT5589.1:40-642(+)